MVKIDPRVRDGVQDAEVADESEPGLDEPGTDELEDDFAEIDPDDGTEAGQEPDDGGGDQGQSGGTAEVNDASALSKRQREMIRLRQRAQAAERERDETRVRLSAIEQQVAGRRTQEDEVRERERIALMTADEKLDYYRQKDRQDLDRRFAQMQFMSADQTDRATFERLCARVPAYESVSANVESELAEARRAGINPSREIIAQRIIGRQVVERASRAKPKQQRKGQESITREMARPSSARGDVRSGSARLSEAAARAKRLENMEI